jgi:hypothetical protein
MSRSAHPGPGAVGVMLPFLPFIVVFGWLAVRAYRRGLDAA